MHRSKAADGPPIEGGKSSATRLPATPSREEVRHPLWAPVSEAERAAAFRIACRLFRGFELLPAAVVESVRGFPFFFVARRGELPLREREIIARTITGEPPGAFGADPRDIEDEARRGSRSLEAAPELTGRELELADFAGRITQRWETVSGDDVERLFAVGYTPAAVREAADVALVFRVVHRLTQAVSAHVAAIPVTTRDPARHRAASARSRRSNWYDPDEDDEGFLVLPPLAAPRAAASRGSSDPTTG